MTATHKKSSTGSIDLRLAVNEWTKGQFVMRSSFYTGRGPNFSDLNQIMLERIYQGIQAAIGQTEATNFVQFVAALKDLSASAFIQSFEQFWYGGCVNVSPTQVVGSGRMMTGRANNELMAEGLALLGSALGGGNMDTEEVEHASYSIKYRFVCDHLKELTSEQLETWDSSPTGSWSSRF